MDFEGIGRVAANTHAGCLRSRLTAMAVAYSMNKNWDISFLRRLRRVTRLCLVRVTRGRGLTALGILNAQATGAHPSAWRVGERE
jgi:hypothetical protein